jgi:anti-anti-sigma factor
VHARSREGSAAVVISGECDVCAAPELARLLLDALAQRPERLVFDLAGVTFMDCAAARVLVAASRAAPGTGKAVILRMSWPTARLLQLTGFSSHFRIVGHSPGYRPPRPRCGREGRVVPLARRADGSPVTV